MTEDASNTFHYEKLLSADNGCDAAGLVAATRILETVVEMHESRLMEEKDLELLGSHSFGEVRTAVEQVALHVGREHRALSDGYGFSTVDKTSRHGDVQLVLFDTVPWHTPDKLGGISLAVWKRDSLRYAPLSATYPLQSDYESFFLDTRKSRSPRNFQGVHFRHAVGDSFDLEKFRFLWRGYRWICGNLLNWDREFLLPEHLDARALLGR